MRANRLKRQHPHRLPPSWKHLPQHPRPVSKPCKRLSRRCHRPLQKNPAPPVAQLQALVRQAVPQLQKAYQFLFLPKRLRLNPSLNYQAPVPVHNPSARLQRLRQKNP